MKKTLLLFILPLFIVACDSNTKSAGSGSDSLTKDSTGVEVPAAEDKPEVDSTKIWTYSSDVDKMTSKTRSFASISAVEKLEFDFPYDGGSTASVMIRNQDGSNDILLSVDKGQFICDVSDGCVVKVRFDEKAAIDFTASEPSDGSSTLLFISPAGKFIKQAKQAKKMIVQAEFYESGLKTMEFNIEGLKWDH